MGHGWVRYPLPCHISVCAARGRANQHLAAHTLWPFHTGLRTWGWSWTPCWGDTGSGIARGRYRARDICSSRGSQSLCRCDSYAVHRRDHIRTHWVDSPSRSCPTRGCACVHDIGIATAIRVRCAAECEWPSTHREGASAAAVLPRGKRYLASPSAIPHSALYLRRSPCLPPGHASERERYAAYL